MVRWVRHWELWTHTTPLGVAWILLCEAAVVAWAVIAVVDALRDGWPPSRTWAQFALLAVATVLHMYYTRAPEERRRVAQLSRELIDHTGIWTVAAALLLPAHMLVLLVVSIRVARYTAAHKPPVRVLFGTAGILASALGANAVVGEFASAASLATSTGVAHVLLAAGVYYFAQTAVLGIARGIRLGWDWQNTIGNGKENADFIATVALGLLAVTLTLHSTVTSLGLAAALVYIAVVWTRNANALTAAEVDAHHDELTRLYNRRGFIDRTDHVLSRHSTSTVMLLDLDHFKAVNDTFGHPGGDEVLRQVSSVLRGHTRQEKDLLCRHGGEELIALLPDTPPEDAVLVAERIRRSVEQLRVLLTRPAGGQPIIVDNLSVSIGIAFYPRHGVTREALEHAADLALYRAKKAGRNRVCIAMEAGPANHHVDYGTNGS